MSTNYHLQDAQFSEQTIAVLATHDASNTTTGSLLTSGGLGVKLSAHIGETLHVNSVNVTPSLGDIVAEREQPLSNDVSSPASISDFLFYNDSTRSFVATVSAHVSNEDDSNLDKNAVFTLHGTLQANNWYINSSYTGDVTGIKFYIQNTSIGPRPAGQIMYTNPNGNGTSTTIRFKANTISPTGASNDAGPYASSPVSSSNTTFSPTTATNWDANHTDVSTALDELASRLANVSFANEFHVAKSGNDSTGNGSFERPFLSITAALDIANTLPNSNSVAVHIHPGVYTENVVLSKPKVSLIGNTSTFSNACQINGSITVNPSTVLDSVFNTIYTIENLLVTKNTGTAVLQFTGSNAGYLYVSNCKLWTSGAPKVVHFNNTSSTTPRFRILNSQLNCSSGSGACFEIETSCNATGVFKACDIYGNTTVPIVVRSSQNTLSANTSNTTFNDCSIEGNAAFLSDVQNASITSFLYSTLTNYSVNSSGINIASTAVAGAYYSTFSIPSSTTFPGSLTPPDSTTGYAVKGAAGSFFGHGSVTFVSLMNINGTMYWTTNKYSNAMTTFASQSLSAQA